MVTGDNPLTAVAVAREIGLVAPLTDVYLSKLVKTDGKVDLGNAFIDDRSSLIRT